MTQPIQPQPFKLPIKPVHNPLDDNDHARLQEALTHLHIAEDLIHRAASCGLNVQDRLDRHATDHQVAKLIKERFFPDQMPVSSE